MHPELFTLPGGFSIKTYGFFLMLGFLSGVWLAMRRSERAGCNPDRMLDLAFLLLVFGIGGARLFYVAHYWDSRFADLPNKFFAIINITEGGLEFLGGFLGALVAVCVYCWWTRISLRLYLDVIAPSAMWGLALGRIGCFFNGCCFGGLAATAPGQPPSPSWAVRFPYGSPAHYRHFENREVAIPADLMVTTRDTLQPVLVPPNQLEASVAKRDAAKRAFEKADKAYRDAKAANLGGAKLADAEAARERARKAAEEQIKDFTQLEFAQQLPSRENPERGPSVSELQALASQVTSAPVHPAQLYASGQALLLSLFLTALLWVRRRHGVVLGVLLLLYPVQRVLEELIRADNPHDVAGLTISQSISVGMFLVAVAYLIALYRVLPERSPLAERFPPDGVATARAGFEAGR